MKSLVKLLVLVAVLAGATVFFFDRLPLDKNSGIYKLLSKYIKPNATKTTTATETVVVKTIISSVRGEVLIVEKGMPERQVRENEILNEGSMLETKEQSTALISFKGGYEWKMRIGASTKVNIDELMKVTAAKYEDTLFTLIKGGISLVLTNPDKPVHVKVKTPMVTFAVRGTKFAVLTDGESHSVLTVEHGEVEAENFRNSKKDVVKTGYTYIADNQGLSKVDAKPEAVQLYDWNLENQESTLPDIHSVLSVVGDVEAASTGMSEESKRQLIEEINKELTVFKTHHENYKKVLATLESETNATLAGFNAEETKALNDIRCMQTSKTECQLSTEKALYARGFPRTWGTPTVKNAIVEEIKKIIQDRKDDLAMKQTEIEAFKALMQKREEAIKTVEEKTQSGTDLETLQPLLRNPDLTR